MTRVEVIWEDAHIDLDETTVAEASEVGPVVTHTVGWLVSQDDRCIRLAIDTWPSHPDRIGGLYTIPRGMVVNVIELRPTPVTPFDESTMLL